ncbi:MAG: hypothetical protein WBA93_04335 [Microcoleaceae cyanobacterium]
MSIEWVAILRLSGISRKKKAGDCRRHSEAIARSTKALEFRNYKSFRKVTEEGYSGSHIN